MVRFLDESGLIDLIQNYTYVTGLKLTRLQSFTSHSSVWVSSVIHFPPNETENLIISFAHGYELSISRVSGEIEVLLYGLFNENKCIQVTEELILNSEEPLKLSPYSYDDDLVTLLAFFNRPESEILKGVI